jgi:CRP/FNR family transcriptional regulator, cyclic AMP receptor protein
MSFMSTPVTTTATGKSSPVLKDRSLTLGRTVRPSREDPLAYLPQKRVQEFKRQQAIYTVSEPCNRLYMVTTGRVLICGMSGEGRQAVTRIVGQGSLFGESALVEPADSHESALTLDQTGLMAWTRAEVESLTDSNPRLGLALTQYFARQCLNLNARIQNYVIYNTPERTALALIELANSLGTPTADGAMRLRHLTHVTLAQYVGTSREIVTCQMIQLRKLRLVKYNHKFADVYTAPLEDMLRARGVTVSREDGLPCTAGLASYPS